MIRSATHLGTLWFVFSFAYLATSTSYRPAGTQRVWRTIFMSNDRACQGAVVVQATHQRNFLLVMFFGEMRL